MKNCRPILNPENIVFLKEYSKDYSAFTDCKFIKIIKVEFLKTKLPVDCHFIFTSKNSILAVKESLGDEELRKSQNIYCLGQKSSLIAAEVFKGHTIYGKDACSSDQLAGLVVDHEGRKTLGLGESQEDRSIIGYAFFTGDKSLQTLPNILQNHRIACRQIQVYKTSILAIDSNLLQNKIVVLFSPSGLRCVENILDINCTWIAIGNTTRQALIDAGVNRIYTSKSPTPEGVMDAIMECLDDKVE